MSAPPGPSGSRLWSAILAGAAIVAISACAGQDDPDSSGLAGAGLDYDYYQANVEPIFTRPRGGFAIGSPGGPSCVMCHTWQTNAPLKLEPLPEVTGGGVATWTEEQSRRNFQEVARLVTAGDPDGSRLLLAPLSEEAGGRGDHTGGVFWESKDDPEWQALAGWIRMAEVGPPRPPPPEVDFEFFQSCVQPVFLIPTPGALPCAECHQSGPEGFAPPIGGGRAIWNEEESRRNFEVVMRLVEPGEPTRSRLLMHPLAYEAGGDYTHNGPRRWTSMDDPEWQMLAGWVRGERTGPTCDA